MFLNLSFSGNRFCHGSGNCRSSWSFRNRFCSGGSLCYGFDYLSNFSYWSFYNWFYNWSNRSGGGFSRISLLVIFSYDSCFVCFRAIICRRHISFWFFNTPLLFFKS